MSKIEWTGETWNPTDGWGAVPIIGVGPGSREKGRGLVELPYLDGVQHAAFPEAR